MNDARRRILLVDDEPGALERVVPVLRREGLDVEAVTSGRAALAALAKGGYAVICLDLTLPDLPASVVCERIRRTPGLERVPVLALVARAHPVKRADAEEFGVTDFLDKPFDPRELGARVRRLLAEQPAESEEERRAL